MSLLRKTQMLFQAYHFSPWPHNFQFSTDAYHNDSYCPWHDNILNGHFDFNFWVNIKGEDRCPQWTTQPTTTYPSLYRVSLPRATGSIGCPMGSSRGGQRRAPTLGYTSCKATCGTKYWFWSKGTAPPPLCMACDMLVHWLSLKCFHPFSDVCARRSERKIQSVAEEEAQSGAVTALRDYYRPL